MTDVPARIKAIAAFGVTSWSPARHQDLPVEMMDITEYVRADIADQMLAALEAVVAWQDSTGDFGVQALMTERQVRAAIAKAKGEDE